MRGYLILSIVAVLALLSSCRTNKEIPKAKKQSLSEVLAGMESAQREYQFFSAKANVKFEGEEMRVGGRANIRIIKDSLIWMNFKKLSIEGSRALITQDSFWIVYRLDKMYESGTFEELMEAYDLTFSFSQLQDYIVGNYPVPTAGQVKDYKAKKLYMMSFSENANDYIYQVDGAYQLRDFTIVDAYGRQVQGSYSDYGSDGYAYRKNFDVQIDSTANGGISIDLMDVEFDVPKKISFDVPSHYYKLP